MTFFQDDDLGQQLLDTRRALMNGFDAVGELIDKLTAERESHREQCLRLVERAERAEARVAALEAESGEDTVGLRRLPARIDPRGCGCTDCLTGYSMPAEFLTGTWRKQLQAGLTAGTIQDARS